MDEPTLADNLGVVEDQGSTSCDNLDGDGHCLLPFPSDHWRDASTGKLALVQEAMPTNASGQHLSVDTFDQDGFGIGTPVLFQLDGATLTGLPPALDAGPSLLPDAHTVLIDAASGTLIPHWLETDWLDSSTTNKILVLRTAVPLPASARIVVGVRGLVDASGTAMDAPEGFRSLRDQVASHRVGVHARRAHYDADIFPVLEAAGFARDELQLAWDFTTRSDAGAIRDLQEVTAAMYTALGDTGPSFVIDNINTSTGDASIAVIVDATAQIPSFLLPAGEDDARLLRRDASGSPVAEGFESVAFRIQVPYAALEGEDPAPVLQYGHGLLGGLEEANNGWLRRMAERHRFVILASDMQGMSEESTLVWSSVLLGDAGHMSHLTDEAMQGVANHLALQRLMAEGMNGDAPPALLKDDAPVWDPETLWYHGNSQGGTMGTLVLATSRDVARGVLGVPGCAFPFLLDRSSDFVDWALLLQIAYPEPGDITLVLSMLGTAWDHMDGVTWAQRVAANPLPNTPAHQALLHVGLEDAQVMNELSWHLGRAMGAVQPTGQVRSIWQTDQASLPITGAPAVIVNWDFGVAADDTPMDPPVKETDTHGAPRALAAAQDQSVHFFRTGDVIDVCDGGPCVFSRP